MNYAITLKAPPALSLPPRLSIRDLRHGFTAQDGSHAPVLDRLDFTVGAGEIVAIVGRSGAGKSTLFNLISGLISPSSGEIAVGAGADGTPGTVAYMLQKDLLLPWRTVMENVLLGLELYGGVTQARRDEAEAMLGRYGLGGLMGTYPHSLSGGMRQRVALIRTLMIEPSVVLLDEPFSALDYETRLMLEDDVMALRNDQGMSVVLVTHDIEEAIAMSDRVIVLGGRPARIADEIPIDLTVPGQRDAITAREAPEFRTYHARIWGGLRARTAP
jgi:NitT/TauT family transport system ATP-binding protein